MKRFSVFLLLFTLSLTAWKYPVMASDQSSEINRLKEEIQNIQEQYKNDIQFYF